MPTPATRLLTLIMLLQRRPRQKAGDLARELGVSVRTVHRYMEMLDEMGIPIYTERGPDGGFSLVRGYKMPPLVFTPEEAVSLYLGAELTAQMWGPLYAQGAQGAQAKLENVLPDEQRQEVVWARRSLIAFGLNRAAIDSATPHLTALRSAMHDRVTVRMDYERQADRARSIREFDAYALVHRTGWWYVVGYCHLRKALRTFRVDRVVGIVRTQRTYEVPPDFDVHEYLAREWQTLGGVRVRLRFAPEGVPMARDFAQQWAEMEELPDGSLQVTWTAIDLNWAASVVLSFGGLAVAEEPPELVDRVRAWAEAVAAQHGDA